jgi:hypothetical protein
VDGELFFSSLLEVEYLANCPIVKTDLPRIADYATNSRLLTRRYAATTVVEKWANHKLDPFDPASIRSWWTEHKDDYEK